MSFFSYFLQLKFKYVISFIFVLTFYIFAFEKRYFQINSDWKVLCHENSIALCEFQLKISDIESVKTKNLAIYSQSSDQLVIVDVFNSSMTNADVLSAPTVVLIRDDLRDFVLFDVKRDNEGRLIFYGVSQLGTLSCYSDWNLMFSVTIFNETSVAGGFGRFTFHFLEFLLKENIVLISGVVFSGDNRDGEPMVYSVNGSDGAVNWRVSLRTSETILSDSRNKTRFVPNSEIFSHWKLNLMQHHRDLNHLKQKTDHINLKSSFPVYFNGVNRFVLSKIEKQLRGVDKKQGNTDRFEDNYNSMIVVHKYGMSLLDIHSGVLMAAENLEFDTHSTYTYWPSDDYQQKESLFQVKFVSKLDHYSKNEMDINHQQDKFPTGTETHQHKIHCNLIFNKLDPSTSLSHEINNWFYSHLCDPVSYMDYPRFSEETWLEDPLKAISPLITNDYATPSGVWGHLYHLIGRKLSDTNSKNVICISSDGLMTSLSSHGHQNWRTNAQIGWLHISRMAKMTGSSYVDSTTKQVYEKYFYPSLTEIRLSYLNQTIRAVISLGFDSMSLVDLSDGYMLASHSLPCTPVEKPIVISVPSRGILSVSGDLIMIVKCENMVLGFSTTHYIPWMYFLTLCVLMLAAILFLMWSLDPRNSYFGELWV